MENFSPRVRRRNDAESRNGPVVYWMQRDQRVRDNWALLYAQALALETKSPLTVFFCAPQTGMTARQWGFTLQGLREVAHDLSKLNIAFVMRVGAAAQELSRLHREMKIGALVADFSPLRDHQAVRASIAQELPVAFYEVDAHNIVPCWKASPKLEFAAATLRPKIHRALGEYLVEFPKVKKHPCGGPMAGAPDFEAISLVRVDESVPEVTWLKPGERAARKMLDNFIKKKLQSYGERRNDPTADFQSNLSPYLHFGQLSAQRVALEVSRVLQHAGTESFLEELIVRRELADNFCFYSPHYDSVDGFWDWAKRTLAEHAHDARPYLYSKKQLECAETHDDLWNAAQREMVHHGKMHGYLRMYWAKKILEWTPSPKEALAIALYLNDKYELDGNDPNGYCGVAWSIGGVHDRAWFNKAVFGKIRFMSYNGCKSKFKIQDYIKKTAS